MKQFLVTISAGLACFCISCNDKSGSTDSTTQKNLDAIHGINKAIETGDVSKLGDYIATDAIDHAGPKGDVKGLDSIKAIIAKMSTYSKDAKTETIKELADNEYVFQWLHFTGTSTSSEMGMPPGTKYDMNALEVSKHKDGKATEHWEFMSPQEMMKMMPPPPPPAPTKDMMDSANHK